ncbi:MAG TPA: tRNA (adenosine(37)-N6)-threonylcarbamoyltransferase complex transferase subunit TsaD [Candidatus Limnocylindrales bacterium]|nr:tRNA (adenosine(37)-N6)-threonylcarbamoyltransferase complex transferase subunit TsaD [Candidatus Limnocylindrales bacterium]
MSSGLILAVESSCDETAVAIVRDGRRIVANVVASQVALHAASGGIVPEVAARAHLRWMIPVLDEARRRAGLNDLRRLEAIAVTEGPGLAGSLLVGIQMAKTLAWLHDLPLVPVNHLEGHIYAAWLLDPDEDDRPAPEFPLIALVVSGGHTFLVEMADHLTYRLLGQTVDDAAGEAFDKVGRMLGLPYPGGPAIQRAAEAATGRERAFPRAWLGNSFDFSFSGLKTAARREVARQLGADPEQGPPDDAPPLPPEATAELAYAFQESVVDVLAAKTVRAAHETAARAIVVGGGVAANSVLRERLEAGARSLGVPLIVPRPALCTDNAAMIGAAGFQRARSGARADLGLAARPSLRLASAKAA